MDVTRKIHHTRLKNPQYELNYGREPNTEISNLLNLNALENITKSYCFSANPGTLQVYSFNGAGGASD